MPNNFRKIPDVGGFFVSKDGDDGTAIAYNGANLADARNNPRKTIPIGTVKSIIGAGKYSITASLTGGAHCEADGKVVLYGDSTFNFIGDNGQYRFNGVVIEQFVSLTSNVAFGTSTARATFFQCEFRIPNLFRPGTNASTLLRECQVNYDSDDVFYCGQTGNPSNIGTPSINNTLSSNTFNVITQIQTGSAGQPTLIHSQNVFIRDYIINNLSFTISSRNSFNGQITIAGTTYSSFADPQLAIDHPTFVDAASQNFQLTQSLAQCFNNIVQNDFSLRSTSQLIFEDFNVGALPFMFVRYAAVDPELTLGNQLTVSPPNSAVGTTNIRVIGGQDFTELTSGWIQATDNLGEEIEMGVLDLVNQISFDSDLSTSQPDNENVPVVVEYPDGTDGANPRRLTFEVRTSSKATIPTQDSDADNSFIIPAGDYINHEFNFEKLEFDNLAVSKGLPTYNPDLEQLVVRCAWFQLRVTLQDKL